MKVSELISILQPVPGNFDVEIFYGHSQLDIVSSGTSTFGKALVLTCEEERDLSDPEKHEEFFTVRSPAPPVDSVSTGAANKGETYDD